MQGNSESKLPWEIDSSNNQDVVSRGRKPGQLKGISYNVPKRKQISVSLLEKDIQKIDKIAKEMNVARSKIIGELISTHPRMAHQT